MRVLLYLFFSFLLMACATTSTIHTQPLGAEVYINGQRCGVSPCIHHQRYGFPDRMRVQIRNPGYKSVEFFVDSQAPVASYALYGFGSYFLHGFAKEYRFSLEPHATTESKTVIQRSVGGGLAMDDAELTSVLEQCMYWSEQNTKDVWSQRFFESAASLDCKIAQSALETPRTLEGQPKPSLARALVRYVAFHRRKNLPSITLPWSTDVLCDLAKVEYAKRIGASEVPPALPAFDLLCPEESKQLRNE